MYASANSVLCNQLRWGWTVQESDCWRVKIGSPGTPPHYFGHFKSEHEAEKWIADHHWMIQQACELVPDEAP
jgi:hypothetical protein